MKKVFIDEDLKTEITLDKANSHHVLNVLRHNTAKPLVLANNKEGWANYEYVQSLDNGTSIWRLVSEVYENKDNTPIIIVQSFLKGDKFEYVLQKCTELNVDFIIGISTKNTVVNYDAKINKKTERWQKIIIEASQQAGRYKIPEYCNVSNLKQLFEYIEVNFEECLKLVAYEAEEENHLKGILRENYANDKPKPVLILIGPEGGFDHSEILLLNENGFKSVSLGNNILRAETAAIAVASIVNYERG